MMALLSLAAALAAGPSDPQRWTRDDGTTLVLVEDHRVPLIELRLSFPVGHFSPWFVAHHGPEAFELQLYDSAGALRARADALAAEFSFRVDDYSSDLVVTCLREDLPSVLALVKDVLHNKDYDPAELKRAAQGRDVAWKSSEKDFEFVIEQAGRRLLYPEGDPRRNKTEQPEKLLQDAATLAATRDDILALPGRLVGVAGDTSGTDLPALADALGLPPITAAPADLAPVFQPVLANRPPAQAVHLPKLTQVYFAYLRDDISWSDPDYAAALVANHVLGGHFFSRLYVALRHEGGETYGARVTRDPGPAPGPLALATFTRAENRSPTEEKLRAVLATFHTGGITETELFEAQRALEGARRLRREAPGQILETFAWEHARGLPAGFKDEQIRQASALTLEQVNRFITRTYDPAAFTMLTLEPE